MRLLMLSWRYADHPMAGGAEVLTHEVLRRLVANGHSVACFTAAYPGSERAGTIDGVELIRCGRQWTVQGRAWRWARHRLDDFDLVVDQINTIPFFTPCYMPGGRGVLFICQLARGYWFRETRGLFRAAAPLGYVGEPHMLRLYRGIPAITISNSTKADLVRLGLDADQITVIPMALTQRPLPVLPTKEGALRVIIVGRLTPAKFVEEGIRTFELVKREVQDAELDIVGSGDARYGARLRRMVSRRKISGVTFHGRVDEQRKRDLLKNAHVHVFTSHREGWGLVVSEAAAMGTPSVGYDVPGVRDSIAEPRLLAPRGETTALAARINMLSHDPELYAELRYTAWNRTQSMSYDDTALAFERPLLEALSSSALLRTSRGWTRLPDRCRSSTRDR